MGMKFGEIDINQVVENEFRIRVLEDILEWMLNHSECMDKPSEEELAEIKKTVVSQLQKKYPKSGIKFSDDES